MKKPRVSAALSNLVVPQLLDSRRQFWIAKTGETCVRLLEVSAPELLQVLNHLSTAVPVFGSGRYEGCAMHVDARSAEITQQFLLLDLGYFDLRIYLTDTVGLIEASEVAVLQHVGHQQNDMLADAFSLGQVLAHCFQAKQDLTAGNVGARLAHGGGKDLAEALEHLRRLVLEAGLELTGGHHRYATQYLRVDWLLQLAGVAQAGVVTFKVRAEGVQADLVAWLHEALDVAPGSSLQVLGQGSGLVHDHGQHPAGRRSAELVDAGLGVAARNVITFSRQQSGRREQQRQSQV